ncbi:hypothetical protein [Rhodococcus sp. BS-15]|uniref:hypothetical protein n=1 Tax=Rhodococcus sp. BS-15 TaxID=1304954 RepID=UPI000AB22BC8|nr:hypothetical protein [Rhodococcus sp. BS-15]
MAESSPTMTLDAITFPAGDPYRVPDVYRAAERFWWHEAVAAELRRLRDECTNPSTGEGYSAFSVSGIAGNIKGMNAYDVAKYCRQMITWGELVKAEPLWDFEPELWVALSE